MIEYNQAEQSELANLSGFGVKVIGVGGAGANVLDRMALEGSDDAELLTLTTDVRALSTSVSSEKIQLGATLLKGMGTGGDPSLGKQAAIEAVDEIREAVRSSRMVFVCVGLGGGTGSGAAPEVCRIAREEGVFLVVFATMPFSFEGERRTGQAKTALEQIGRYANAVVTFDNDRMGELIVPKDGVAQAFAAADKIISQSIRATMNVVFRPGIIRIGMDDLLSAIDSDDSRSAG
jgi:cell division protein FtsZ